MCTIVFLFQPWCIPIASRWASYPWHSVRRWVASRWHVESTCLSLTCWLCMWMHRVARVGRRNSCTRPYPQLLVSTGYLMIWVKRLRIHSCKIYEVKNQFHCIRYSNTYVFFFFFAGVCDGLLLVYSDIHIDVFEVLSGDWVQTINLKRTKPLMRTGILNMVMISDLPHVAYLRNLHKGDFRWSGGYRLLRFLVACKKWYSHLYLEE